MYSCSKIAIDKLNLHFIYSEVRDMGLCFRKSITIAPGVRVNLSKSGPSISFGKKGIRETISATGKSTTTLGIPGTGVYYKKSFDLKKIGKGKIGIDAFRRIVNHLPRIRRSSPPSKRIKLRWPSTRLM